MKVLFSSCLAILLMVLASGCACNFARPDLDAYMLVASSAAGELVVHPAIYDFPQTHSGNKPRVGVGRIKNDTGKEGREYFAINVEQITDRILDTLLMSEQVVISDPETDPRPPDYHLQGSISQTSRIGNDQKTQVPYCTFTLELKAYKQSAQLWRRTKDVAWRCIKHGDKCKNWQSGPN